MKFISLTSVIPSYLCNTTRCLSKLHDFVAMTFIILVLSLKVKTTTCSPSFLALNPFVALYKGEKVFAIASKLRARQVKNLATNTHSVSTFFSINQMLEPSQSQRVSLLHDFVGSSICNEAKKTENEKEMRYRNNKEGIRMEGKKGREGSVS